MKVNNENVYRQRVLLLLQVLPIVMRQSCFCLKGGTALNLFIQDFPRISVDIDLTYIHTDTRSHALVEIESALSSIKRDIENEFIGIKVIEKRANTSNQLMKLFVFLDNIQVTIEPNFVLRGTLFNPQLKDICPKAEQEFQLSVLDIPLLHTAELYAGKFCAALDRQHPRDLFDVYLLYQNGEITKEIRQAFVVYLACSPRPMSELLNPNRHDTRDLFVNEFEGMTSQPITLEQLYETRERLITDLQLGFTDSEREFLLSIKRSEPDWDLLNFKGLSEFPALKWKLHNIKKMDPDKHKLQLDQLENVLNMDC